MSESFRLSELTLPSVLAYRRQSVRDPSVPVSFDEIGLRILQDQTFDFTFVWDLNGLETT